MLLLHAASGRLRADVVGIGYIGPKVWGQREEKDGSDGQRFNLAGLASTRSSTRNSTSNSSLKRNTSSIITSLNNLVKFGVETVVG